MPITNPQQCRDKTADWMSFFAEKRRAQLAELVNDHLIEEHRLRPRGSAAKPHSRELQEVLNYMRHAPAVGKSFAYAVEPYKKYVVGVMTARGLPAEISEQSVYETEDEAVHAVFLERLETLGIYSTAKTEV